MKQREEEKGKGKNVGKWEGKKRESAFGIV